jgi:hypothetical protein
VVETALSAMGLVFVNVLLVRFLKREETVFFVFPPEAAALYPDKMADQYIKKWHWICPASAATL